MCERTHFGTSLYEQNHLLLNNYLKCFSFADKCQMNIDDFKYQVVIYRFSC